MQDVPLHTRLVAVADDDFALTASSILASHGCFVAVVTRDTLSHEGAFGLFSCDIGDTVHWPSAHARIKLPGAPDKVFTDRGILIPEPLRDLAGYIALRRYSLEQLRDNPRRRRGFEDALRILAQRCAPQKKIVVQRRHDRRHRPHMGMGDPYGL